VQRYYHKSPGTESLFVVIPHRSGFPLRPRNILDEVKALASKLQKRDHDKCEAYMMVNVKSARKTIDSDFQIWYKEILDLAEKLELFKLFPERPF